MQDFLSPYFLVALSGVFAVLALYLPLRLQRALEKYARLKKNLLKLKDAERMVGVRVTAMTVSLLRPCRHLPPLHASRNRVDRAHNQIIKTLWHSWR